MSTKANESAYPSIHPRGFSGLTKREWLAGLALQGMLSNSSVKASLGPDIPNDNNRYAKVAIELADALIDELNKDRE